MSIFNIFNLFKSNSKNTNSTNILDSDLEFIKNEEEATKEVYFLVFENEDYFSINKEIDLFYDKSRIEIEVLIPNIIKELIEKIGIKEVIKNNLFYNKIYGKTLILKNDLKIELVLLKRKEMLTMSYDQIFEQYTLGLSNESKDVYFSIEEKKEKSTSNSYGMNFTSHKKATYTIKQLGVSKISQEYLGKNIDDYKI